MHGQHTFSTARIKVGAGRVISVYIKGCNYRRFLLHCWPLHRASKAVKHVALKQLDLHFVSASTLVRFVASTVFLSITRMQMKPRYSSGVFTLVRCRNRQHPVPRKQSRVAHACAQVGTARVCGGKSRQAIHNT